MAYATNLLEYLGASLAVDRPVTPNVKAEAVVIHYATDTTATSFWADGAWRSFATATLGDGDYGDLIVSGGGTAINFDSSVVTAFAKTFLDDANAAAVRTTLGLAIGTNVQAFDAELAALAGLTSAADTLPYFTGVGAAALATFTSFGRSLVDDANAAAARTTLGLGTAALLTSDTDTSMTANSDANVATQKATKAYVDGAFAIISSGIPTLGGFVSGGQAIWVSGFTYRVTAASYFINGTLYSSAEQTITLNAADGTFDRIDVLALDTSGTLVKITGTAAAAPSEPDIDPATQIEVTFVTVATLATAPATALNENIYLENAEWTTTVTGAHINAASTSNPRTSSKDVEATAALTGDSILFNKGSTLTPSNYSALVFYIRNKTASWGTTRLRLHFQNAAGSRIGSIVDVQSGTFGFLTSNTTTYQAVSIPLTNFAIPAGNLIQKLNLAVTGATTVGWYIDDVILQLNGAGSGSTSGLTQTQADARYAQRAANLSDLQSATTALTNLGLTANGKSLMTAANYAAMRTLLGLVIGTDIPARSPSIQSVASAATVTPTFADDQVEITAQAAALNLANPTGTAVDGWGISIRIKDNGTARAIAYNGGSGSQYRAIGVTLPTTTVVNKTLYLGMIWNSTDSKWDVVAVAQEA